ncbi:MAG: adenylate/guanylate cyclase domain-containing protein, partial [Burkholderiales bacterium]
MPAVLFADISGSTMLYETLGDAAAKTLVDECLDIMRSVTVRRGGRVIKTIGDELMCVFHAADRGSLAATDKQLAVSTWPAASGVS